jgi:hypothetical protein
MVMSKFFWRYPWLVFVLSFFLFFGVVNVSWFHIACLLWLGHAVAAVITTGMLLLLPKTKHPPSPQLP